MSKEATRLAYAAVAAASLAMTAGCTPTVRVVAPSEPIEINLNVTIDQRIRVEMDEEIQDMIADNPDLF